MRGRFRRTKRLLFYAAVRTLQWLATRLPRSAALPLFSGIGRVVHVFDRPAIRRSRVHLEIAFGSSLSEERVRGIVLEMFRATARGVVDVFRMAEQAPEERLALVDFRGYEHLEHALGRGRGAILLSAHLGNWEVLGAALAARGVPLHVVARELFDERSDRLLASLRRRLGVRVHPRSAGLYPVVRALRAGETVGTLVDQDTGSGGVFVPFFGRAARTPDAPFELAARLGAPLVPILTHVTPGNRHEVEVFSEIDTRHGVRRAIEAWHRLLEAAIRRHPEQWVWHHRRWKSTPQPRAANLRTLSKKMPYLSENQRSRGAVATR